MPSNLTPSRCLCGNQAFSRVCAYTAPPEGETHFSFSSTGQYHREIHRCLSCGHFVSVTEMDLSGLYQQDYVAGTYGDAAGLKHAFDRINALPRENSDNLGRVKRVLDFAAGFLKAPATESRAPTLLDVGSGLAVFPFRMKQAGWNCTGLDQDPRLVEHARQASGINALSTDFMSDENLGTFDAITFNKVLEHVEDPVSMLARSAGLLSPGGFIYLEVPDGEAALAEGFGREEFFIEHHHIFSFPSLAILCANAGFAPLVIERLREPSTKYTLRAFLRPDLALFQEAKE